MEDAVLDIPRETNVTPSCTLLAVILLFPQVILFDIFCESMVEKRYHLNWLRFVMYVTTV